MSHRATLLLGSGVDGVLQLLAGLEFWRLAGRYRLRFAGPGVPTLPGRSIGDGERSEAGQSDFLSACQRRRDRDQRLFDGPSNCVLGLVGGIGDGGDQVGLVHGGALGSRVEVILTTPRSCRRQQGLVGVIMNCQQDVETIAAAS